MSSHEDSPWFLEFLLVIVMYSFFIICFLLSIIYFNLSFFSLILQYLAIAILVSATVFLFYKAYMKKKVIVFILGFTIIGMLIFSLSTIITVPHITTESYISTFSSNWYNSTITLSSQESRNIILTEFWPRELNGNGTVVQFKLSNSGSLRFLLYCSTSFEEKLALNDSLGNFGATEIGEYWHYMYWAPEVPISGSLYWERASIADYTQMTVVVENLENSSEQVSLRVDYYDFTATAQKSIIDYRPAIDSYFGYLGIGLIITAAILELWTWRKRPFIKPNMTDNTHQRLTILQSNTVFRFSVISQTIEPLR